MKTLYPTLMPFLTKKENDYNNARNLEIKAKKEVVENRQACQVETKEVSRKF